MNYEGALTFRKDSVPVITEIEVIMLEQNDIHFLIKMDEESKPFVLPRSRVRVIKRDGLYTTLSLTETKAITYNMV